MEVGAEGGLDHALSAALAAVTMKERRRCEYLSCPNYKQTQKQGDKVLVCGGCKLVGVVTVYCTVECQKQHWKDHKLVCKKTTTTATTTITTATPNDPPALGEHMAPVFSATELNQMLASFGPNNTSPKRSKSAASKEGKEKENGDDDEEDLEFDVEDFMASHSDSDDDDGDADEEDQDRDSLGRRLPQNRKKQRPAFGGRKGDSDDDAPPEKEEPVVPFLPFGPLNEGTNYWNFGVEQPTVSPSSSGELPSPSKHTTPKKRMPRRVTPTSDDKSAKKDDTLAALSFTAPPVPTTDTKTPTPTDAPVFTFGQTDSVPTFSATATSSELPSALPSTFEFGKQ